MIEYDILETYLKFVNLLFNTLMNTRNWFIE